MQPEPHDPCSQSEGNLQLVTPSEAAQILRLSKATVYRLVETRRLSFYRVSGSLRFSKRELEEYIARGRVGSVLPERR